MTATNDERYAAVLECIARDELLAAEALLAATLDESPRAAQSVYLLGAVILMQGRLEEGARLLDRASSLPRPRSDPPRERAISDDDEVRTLYLAEDEDTTLASFVPDRNMLRKFKQIQAVDVQCATFETLFVRYGVKRVDLLQIDVEAFDYQILRMFDLARYRPLMINLEFYCLPLAERVAAFCAAPEPRVRLSMGWISSLSTSSVRSMRFASLTASRTRQRAWRHRVEVPRDAEPGRLGAAGLSGKPPSARLTSAAKSN